MITTNFLMDTAKEVSAEAFEKFGKVFPSCTYFGKDGYGHLFSKNRTDGGREEFIQQIKAVCMDKEAFAVSCLFEARFYQCDPSDSEESNHPLYGDDHWIECLCIYVEITGETSLMRLFPIIREAGGQPRLGPPTLENGNHLRAKLVPLLPSQRPEPVPLFCSAP